MLKTLKEALYWLETQVKFTPKTDLVRITKAYEFLDIDLKDIKKIHVAGTNGKGSTCAFISHILIEAGYSVGTFTSPYLLKFNERIRHQFKEVSDNDLYELIITIFEFNKKFASHFGETLSFFELITLMSLVYFKKKNVDIIVMEVGLGGVLDATNILNYDLSLIVSVGFDHMKQLGTTYESIASNMIGILKSKNHLLTTVDKSMHKFITRSIRDLDVTHSFYTEDDFIKIKDTPLTFKHEDIIYQLSLLGDYQILNALIALKGVQYLFPEIPTSALQKGLFKTKWPGRLEPIGNNVYVDGAHNTSAMEALKKSVQTTFRNKEVWVLFSSLGDKDITGMIEIIKGFSKKTVITSFPDPRFKELDVKYDNESKFERNPLAALRNLKKEANDNVVIIITGSLHFIGFIKKESL